MCARCVLGKLDRADIEDITAICFRTILSFCPFLEEEANSVCFIPRLTACRVIYSSFHTACQEFTPFSSSAEAGTTSGCLLEPSICKCNAARLKSKVALS